MSAGAGQIVKTQREHPCSMQPSDYNDVVTQDVHCTTAEHDRLSQNSVPNKIDYLRLAQSCAV